MDAEYCNLCGEPTDRAGIGDDSIYLDECGPLCESCRDKIIEAVKLDYLPDNKRIAELQGHVSSLLSALDSICPVASKSIDSGAISCTLMITEVARHINTIEAARAAIRKEK